MLKRSRAVTLDGSRTEKSTIRIRDQENVNYPVSLSLEVLLVSGLGTRSPFPLGPEPRESCRRPAVGQALARLLELPAVR